MLFALLAGFLCACAGPEKKAPTVRVAVLPLKNHAVQVDAADKVRAALTGELKDRGYPLVDAAAVDAGLKELGFTSGDQLGALSLESFKAKVPADWYVFGDVEEFSFKSAVALSQREVALRLRVLDPAGQVLFEGADKGITSRAGVDAAGDLAINVAGKIFKGVKDVTKKTVQKTADVASGVVPGGEVLSKTTQKLGEAADVADQVADVDLSSETREAVRKLLDRLEAGSPGAPSEAGTAGLPPRQKR